MFRYIQYSYVTRVRIALMNDNCAHRMIGIRFDVVTQSINSFLNAPSDDDEDDD